MSKTIEVVPAVLRKTFEKLEEDWNKVRSAVDHVQIDVTDGIFAGDGTWREVTRFKQLVDSYKVELHMMVHRPAWYVDDVIDLNPARCIFHLEAFAGFGDLQSVYDKLHNDTQAELAIAINPGTAADRLEEYAQIVDYVMFMGVNPGYTNQPFDQGVYRRIGAWHKKYPKISIAVDGHVNKETIEPLVKAGASILCANTAIFGEGDPIENIKQLELLAQAARDEVEK